MPVSLVFTGHMIDLPGRAEPRFPPSLESAARKEIQKRIECRRRSQPSNAFTAFASGALGGGILFHESCRAAGIKTAIVLPFSPERFVMTSVDGIPNSRWVERFWTLWKDRENTLFTDVMNLPESNEAYAACNVIVSSR